MTSNPTTSTPPIGHMVLYDADIPALEADYYQIIVEQALAFKNGNPDTPSYQFQQPFLVQASRFSLEPGALQSVYPPGNSLGEYKDALPNITLTQPTLPWARSIDANDPNGYENIPWMALLLFDEDELLVSSSNPTPTRASVYPINAILNPPDSDVFFPPLTLDPVEQKQASSNQLNAMAIDISTQTFCDLVPYLNELPFLTHVRQVNPEDKAFHAEATSGWFSIIVGNRLIDAGSNGQPKRQIAHLVSLEGFAPYLSASGCTGISKAKVRLVSLASWYFDAEPDRGNFGVLMQNMSCDLLRFPVQDSCDTCPPYTSSEDQAQPADVVLSDGDTLDPATLVNAALTQGYVALNYGPTHLGESTVAWYRGPLTPILIDEYSDLPVFYNAESAMIYDERTGMFDLSYAVAWEIGRLLALSDKQFAVNLLQMQQQVIERLLRLKSRVELFNRHGAALQLSPDIDALMQPSVVRPAFFNFLTQSFGPRVAPAAVASLQGEAKGNNTPLFTSGDHTGIIKHLVNLPGVLSPEALQDILATAAEPHWSTVNAVWSK